MVRLLPLLLCVTFTVAAQSRVPFSAAPEDSSPRVAQLRKALGERSPGVVTSFWDEIRKTGTPLVEPVSGEPEYSWVTFLWQAKGNTVNVAIIDGVAGGIGEYDPSKNLMTSIPGTDVWFRTYKVRNDAAFTYWISPNDSLQRLGTARSTNPEADPMNPRKSGPQSYLVLSAAQADEAVAPKGQSEVTKITSSLMKNERPVIVYTPPGYQPDGSKYPLLVMLDGGMYFSPPLVDARGILDRLIAQKKIPPTVAVFIGPTTPDSRSSEMTCNDLFVDFLAKEVVPWMRDKYRAGNDATNTIVAGTSLSGLAALFAGFRHSEVFGKVVSLSGSYWWAPAGDERSWLTRQLAESPVVPLHISMSVGLMEVHDQMDTNRHLRDVLIAKGYSLRYSEFNGNHGYISWQVDLPQRLVDVFASH